MSECCRKMFLFLSYLVGTVGSIGYCFYLIWLVAHVKDDGYYWFFAFIPGLIIITSCSLATVLKCRNSNVQDLDELLVLLLSFSLTLMVMCSFTLLTRQAYYHLPTDVFIGPQWVIMSLKGSIVFFVSGFFAIRKCQFERILEDKDILSRALLDFVDIFNLAELLSLNKCVGIGSSVTEGSSLEMAIQAFCTMSFFIMLSVHEPPPDRRFRKAIHGIYMASPIYQNIPFLVIRSIVWARHGVFSLGFMAKNIWAIVVCFAEIFTWFLAADDGGVNTDARQCGYKLMSVGNGNGSGSGSGSGSGKQV